MSSPHMNLRGLDSKSKVDVKQRMAHYARIASFMNADPDEIGKSSFGTYVLLENNLFQIYRVRLRVSASCVADPFS